MTGAMLLALGVSALGVLALITVVAVVVSMRPMPGDSRAARSTPPSSAEDQIEDEYRYIRGA